MSSRPAIRCPILDVVTRSISDVVTGGQISDVVTPIMRASGVHLSPGTGRAATGRPLHQFNPPAIDTAQTKTAALLRGGR
jgi:hypothetical protein